MKRIIMVLVVFSLLVAGLFAQTQEQPVTISYKGQTVAWADTTEALLTKWFGITAIPDPQNAGMKRFSTESGDLAIIDASGYLAMAMEAAQLTITVGKSTFTMGELKTEVDPRMPEPTYTGDTRRPLLYMQYDNLRMNLRLGYDHSSHKLIQVRL